MRDPDEIQELFAGFGPVRIKRMFGGHGIFAGELMIALSTRGELYIKCDAESRPAFEAAGSAPFSYRKAGGEAVLTSYWRLPDAALDDPDELARWARLGEMAARRAAAARAPRRKASAAVPP